jgi:hypothetical protein
VRRVLPKDDKAEVLAVPPETVDIVVEQ